jgi:hypothetical protein
MAESESESEVGVGSPSEVRLRVGAVWLAGTPTGARSIARHGHSIPTNTHSIL